MRILIKDTTLDGHPLGDEGEVFTGTDPLAVVQAMKGATLFSDHRAVEDYIDMVMRNAKMLGGTELVVKGESEEEKAESFLRELVERGFAEVLEEEVARVSVPSSVWQGIDAVRESGRTNMLDRPVVADLAAQMGYPDATNWIMKNPKLYAEGVFRGFVVDPLGRKS